jgi:tRNA-splicing ligase RtcB
MRAWCHPPADAEFPIGGVAATDVERDGVVSPGGVGFDISCGVGLLVSRLSHGAPGPVVS